MLRNIGDQPIPREVREYIADAIDTRMRERPGPKRDKNQELIKTYRAMRHYDDLLPYIQDCKKNGWADCEIDVSEELRDETPGNIVGTLVTQEFWPHASTRHVLNLISEFRKSGKYPK